MIKASSDCSTYSSTLVDSKVNKVNVSSILLDVVMDLLCSTCSREKVIFKKFFFAVVIKCIFDYNV